MYLQRLVPPPPPLSSKRGARKIILESLKATSLDATHHHKAGVTALDLRGDSTGAIAGGIAPLFGEMEYSQILCVENEKLPAFLGFHEGSGRLWFQVYEVVVLEPVLTQYSLGGLVL